MIEQRSEAWHQARAGKITASMFAEAMQWKPAEGVFQSGPRKGQPKPEESTAARDKYMAQLVFERTSGRPVHSISSKSMDWGTESEPLAKEAYEIETGDILQEAEFKTHPIFDFIGASADFLILGKRGGGEIKCPFDEAVHILTWRDGMPADHMPQVQGNILVYDLDYWDFCSYDPRAVSSLRLYRQRIMRDDEYIENMLRKLLQFEAHVKQLQQRVMEKSEQQAKG